MRRPRGATEGVTIPTEPLIIPPLPSQKIIEFGSGRTTSFWRTNVSAAEALNPDFDGAVIQPSYTDPSVGLTQLHARISWSYPIPFSLMDTPLNDLAATNFHTITENFIRADLCRPGTADLSVSADLSAFINNLTVTARVAKVAGFPGVLWDMEAYESSPFWKHSELPAGPTFEEREAIYYSAGRLAVQSVQSYFPNIDLMIAVSYEQVSAVDAGDLSTSSYGLLPKFLDGLHDGAVKSNGIRIVNILEDGYSNETAADWDYDIMQQHRSTMTHLGSDNYEAVHEHSLATFIDYPAAATFDYVTDTNNHHSAADFHQNLIWMFERVPRYGIVYTEDPKWWPGHFTVGVNQMPSVYVAAMSGVKYTP